jgi:hypothetical protein
MMERSRREVLISAAAVAAAAAVPLPVAKRRVFLKPTRVLRVAHSFDGPYGYGIDRFVPQLGGELAVELGREFERGNGIDNKKPSAIADRGL